MLCTRVSGALTLVGTVIVLISGLTCIIWNREVIAKVQVFDTKDSMSLDKCIRESGISQYIPNLCDMDVQFSCNESPDNNTYSICGVAASCLCINSVISDDFFGQMMGASSGADLAQKFIIYNSWFNFAVGISALLGVLPLLVGVIGLLSAKRKIAKACLITGIVFEACGLAAALAFAGISITLTKMGLEYGSAVRENYKNSSGTSSDSLSNTCPYSCQSTIADMRGEWSEFERNMSIATGLDFMIAGVSLIELVCICFIVVPRGLQRRRRFYEKASLKASRRADIDDDNDSGRMRRGYGSGIISESFSDVEMPSTVIESLIN